MCELQARGIPTQVAGAARVCVCHWGIFAWAEQLGQPLDPHKDRHSSCGLTKEEPHSFLTAHASNTHRERPSAIHNESDRAANPSMLHAVSRM